MLFSTKSEYSDRWKNMPNIAQLINTKLCHYYSTNEIPVDCLSLQFTFAVHTIAKHELWSKLKGC